MELAGVGPSHLRGSPHLSPGFTSHADLLGARQLLGRHSRGPASPASPQPEGVLTAWTVALGWLLPLCSQL